MFVYYLALALRSLKRNPALTALMVLAIGFGVGASMTTYAVFRAVSGDPLPDKSNQLFVPQIDNRGPLGKGPGGLLPDSLTYTDATALLHAGAARQQAAFYPVNHTLVPAGVARLPFNVNGYATTAGFFPMFNVPFRFGAGWGVADDRARANMAVISGSLDRKLFRGANSVGRELNLDGHQYRIVGVLDNWNPKPRFYDLNNAFADPPDVFIPLSRALDLQTGSAGSTSCHGRSSSGWQGLLRSECNWISFWVELPTAAAVQHYQRFLEGYAAAQQRSGRFNWPPDTRLRNLMQWLDHEHAVPPQARLSVIVSTGFLLVCMVNTIGLLLAKFMRRAAEVGVRRALGASRRAIFAQFLSEAAMVGVAGGVLGILLTSLGVLAARLVFDPQIARLAQVNASLLGLTVLVAVCATIVAALYPVWCAARVQPAWQLKIN